VIGRVQTRAVIVRRAALLFLLGAALVAVPAPAGALRLERTLASAVAYAHQHDVRVGLAVINLRTGELVRAGSPGTFGTASVVKVLIATRLLLDDRMHGETARRAYRMIIRSDDAAADRLWPLAGRARLVPWLERHYGIEIGRPNFLPGRWGNTQVTAAGLARFFAAAAHDPRVWPWLSRAMAHTRRIAADGTNQYFGIPAAGAGHVVKQGWGAWSAGNYVDATVNSTGIVGRDGQRYAVVILTQGHRNNAGTNRHAFNARQAAVVTRIARMLLPAGRLDLRGLARLE